MSVIQYNKVKTRVKWSVHGNLQKQWEIFPDLDDDDVISLDMQMNWSIDQLRKVIYDTYIYDMLDGMKTQNPC